MRLRVSGEGYEYVQEERSGTPAYIHRLVAVAEYGFDAVVDMDVHHEISVQWLNYGGNLTPENPREHRLSHLQATVNSDTTKAAPAAAD